ncbi:GntR family transcriptional regulator [Rhodococcus sp. WMMA185]|uniref:FadR/GntR family transcriptional regulator n=1 Tax=Rhodococcus sp. WMMA185 TaxID=679318 RepID=UPI00087808EC|nr:FCD domain-containing protein [Rhodococcus sp. WMMA185]AOW91665.1 GntR family transcriptional regulator [Rhodococcus sp. WMMA185]
MSARQTLRSGPLVPQLEDLLTERITAGEWTAGTRLPSEAELAAELGVGRSSVREAVRLLARAGLLDVRHGVGTFVARPPAAGAGLEQLLRRARLLEVYEVRRALEIEASRLAAERVRPEDLRRIRELLEARHDSTTKSTAVFVAADLDFHAAVVDIAGNSILSALFESVRPTLVKALAELVDHEPACPDTGCAHDDLLRALEIGDVEAAVVATAANLDPVMTLLREGETP